MVTVNGEEKNAAGQNLLTFLEMEGYEMTKVVVERNYEIISRDKLSNIVIEDEDVIEVLRFVGGG